MIGFDIKKRNLNPVVLEILDIIFKVIRSEFLPGLLVGISLKNAFAGVSMGARVCSKEE